MLGKNIPIHKGCKQGAPDSLVSWNLWLGEVVGPILEEGGGLGIHLHACETDPAGKAPRNCGGAAGRVNLLADNDCSGAQ